MNSMRDSLTSIKVISYLIIQTAFERTSQHFIPCEWNYTGVENTLYPRPVVDETIWIRVKTQLDVHIIESVVYVKYDIDSTSILSSFCDHLMSCYGSVTDVHFPHLPELIK